MDRIIRILDEMVRERVIDDYALGGATALAYYSDNILTEDIDVFVYFTSRSKFLIDLNPLYEYLVKTKNARAEGQYIILEGFPVQFLVPYDDLSKEAFSNSITVLYGDVQVRIFDLEFLMAIMIQLGKQKYRERLRRLIEENSFDEKKLQAILTKHMLGNKWLDFKRSL